VTSSFKKRGRGIPSEAYKYADDWMPTKNPAIDKPCKDEERCEYMHGCKFKHEPEHGYEWYVKYDVRYSERSAERATDRAATYAEKAGQQKKSVTVVTTKHAQQAAAVPPQPKPAQGGQGPQGGQKPPQANPQAQPQMQPQAQQPQQSQGQRQLSQEEFAKRRLLELEVRNTQEKVSLLMQIAAAMDESHAEYELHQQMMREEFAKEFQANKKLSEEIKRQDREYRARQEEQKKAREAQEAKKRAEEAQVLEEQRRAEEAREARKQAEQAQAQGALRFGNNRGASRGGRSGYYHPYNR